MMRNFVTIITTIVVAALCTGGIYGQKTQQARQDGGGSSDARFGFPIASTHMVNNTTMNPSDMASQFMQSLPGIKLGILSSVATFLAPVLQGLLITALILFALTGTAAIICQMIDCSGALGFNNGHSGFVAATQVAPLAAGFHHHNLIPSGNPLPRRRQGMIQRRPWLSAVQPPPAVQSVEDALEKFDEN